MSKKKQVIIVDGIRYEIDSDIDLMSKFDKTVQEISANIKAEDVSLGLLTSVIIPDKNV